FLVVFFRCWEPSTIFLLARLNFRLLNVVRFYQARVWGVRRFLSKWFTRPLSALNALDAGPAIICGPGVLQFFDRSSASTMRLDVCVGFSGLAEVGRFLASEGYQFRSGPSTSRVRDFALLSILESVYFPERQLDVSGDRSMTQDDHGGRRFRFIKASRAAPLRVVLVHLVRCELHRFVFSTHSTSLVNFITSTHAVSVFPRSTFLKRKSFVGSQERTSRVDPVTKAEGAWLQRYRADLGGLQVIGSAINVDGDAEIGLRWVGDAQCWILPVQPDDNPLQISRPSSGPAFEVLDWTAGVTRHGSYLRIGEPFV
ncbi:hypothetical protein B0H16DRAFT_1269116, partial [Mycena metata]